MKVKVRIAPSPTGFLHIGTAQSALYNWLFARKNKGEFYLRIEDTDKERSTKEYEDSILDSLEWLGLKWDGDTVRQSERTGIYKNALEKLLAEGKAFYCHHTKEELDTERKEQEEKKEAPIHVCSHKNTEEGKKEEGIIRLAVGNKTISFDDEIRGEIKFDSSLLGDFSIAKSLDEALYNFAVVVDDADMKISHVIRGEDHISNTPKQILIYEALGKAIPQFAHLPLILAPDRSKLSKRHGAISVIDYKKDYLSEALLNFLGAMSHTFSKEILTKEEMVSEFELSKVHKSSAVFDVKKLNWFNSQYIKKLEPSKFLELVGIDVSEKAVPLITERLEKLSDIQEFSYLWEEPEYPKELLKWEKFNLDDVKNSLEKTKQVIGSGNLRESLDELAKEVGDRGMVYWPLRVALTGKEKSPDPVEIIDVIGKDKTLERIEKAIRVIGK